MIYLEVDGEKIENSVIPGRHYVIYRLASGELDIFPRKSRTWSPLDKLFNMNKWTNDQKQDYNPHGCLTAGM